MDDHLSSIHNDDGGSVSRTFIKLEQDGLIDSSLISDLHVPKNEPGEEMVMVDPSLVTGLSEENKSTTVPINLILQDGTVLQINAITNGDVDLMTLQNLVSAQLFQNGTEEEPDVKFESLSSLSESALLGGNGGGEAPLNSTAPLVTLCLPQHQQNQQVLENSVVSLHSSISINSTGASVANTAQYSVISDIGNEVSNNVVSDLSSRPMLTIAPLVTNSASSYNQLSDTQSNNDEGGHRAQYITKQKGGWPKGKKRKPEKLVHAPKPPITAYGLFTKQRRLSIREEIPSLTFAEMVKIMGNEWSQLTKEEKQRYVDDALEDKRRYMRELEEYQRSSEYREFIAKQNSQGKGNSSLNTLYNIGKTIKDGVLFCDVCNLYFSNEHNRKEHYLGQRHISNISKLYEADLAKRQQSAEVAKDSCDPALDVLEPVESPAETLPTPLDIPSFMEQFAQSNQDREEEVQYLRERNALLRAEGEQLGNRVAELESMERALSADVAMNRTVEATLSTQLEALLLVPNLFLQTFTSPEQDQL